MSDPVTLYEADPDIPYHKNGADSLGLYEVRGRWVPYCTTHKHAERCEADNCTYEFGHEGDGHCFDAQDEGDCRWGRAFVEVGDAAR